MSRINIKRGDIFWVDLDPAKDTEIQKTRPCVIISHNTMNEQFTRVIVAPITSNVKKVYSFDHKLKENSLIQGKVLLHQIRTVDKSRIGKKITSLSLSEMHEIDAAIKLVLDLQ